MGDEELQYWRYLDGERQQQGPITADELQALAQQGIIQPETEVWTEGLEQWVPATQIEGLFAPAAAPQPVTGQEQPQAVAHPVDPASAAPGAPSTPTAPGVVPAEDPGMAEGHYPATPTKRASFGMILTFLILGVLFMIGGPLAAAALAAQSAETGADFPLAALALMLLGYGVGFLLVVFGQIRALMCLYRAWDLLKWGEPRTTAGKAVGFLFIPLFNLYWIFEAYYGLAKDWNRVMESYPDLQSAPRISGGTALAACICLVSGIGAPIGLIFLLVHFAQICAGINFMASRAMLQTRASGIHLY